MRRNPSILDAVAEGYRRLNFAEQVYMVFIAALLVYWFIEALIPSEQRHPAGRTIQGEQSFLLNEASLRYLEDGRTVRVQRWHGNELELTGSEVSELEVVDVSSTNESGQETAQEETDG